MKLGLVFLPLVLFASACTFNPSPRPCRKVLDCPNTQQCVWSLSDGCGGMGHCDDLTCSNPVPPTQPSASLQMGCACDGGNAFQIGCGWDRPLVSENACR